MDPASIEQKYKTIAANALIAKANQALMENQRQRLRLDPQGKPADKKEAKRIQDALTSIALFELAIPLMGRGDPNVFTILNWKSLYEMSIGHFRDAHDSCQNIVRIARENLITNSATVELARERLPMLAGKDNVPATLNPSTEGAIIADEPAYCAFARRFCHLAVNGDAKQAHFDFTDSLKSRVDLKALKRSLTTMLKMVSDRDEYDIDLLGEKTDWPTQQPGELAWLYFSIHGNVGSEAIQLTLATGSHGLPFAISDIGFGRP